MPLSVTGMAEEFALACVAVQRRFNEEAEARLRLTSLTAGVNVTLAAGRTTGASVVVKPVNIGFQITHGLRDETLSRVSITIEQIPWPIAGKVTP